MTTKNHNPNPSRLMLHPMEVTNYLAPEELDAILDRQIAAQGGDNSEPNIVITTHDDFLAFLTPEEVSAVVNRAAEASGHRCRYALEVPVTTEWRDFVKEQGGPALPAHLSVLLVESKDPSRS